MNIGETLKSMRLHAGLTQTEMAAGIVSESYYSKVERGVHDISADALFKILIKHHLDPVSFFMKMSYRKRIIIYWAILLRLNLRKVKRS